MKGKLIVLEGIDGAGGEVQSKKLVEYLRSQGIPSERIAYPEYDKPVGKLIQEYLDGNYDFHPRFLFLLYASDMVKDLERINLALEKGVTLVCDRYFTSTLAYQSLTMHSIPLEKALEFAEVFGIPRPDLIFYLRISPETSIRRKSQEKKTDVHEGSRIFLNSVREAYDKLSRDNVFGKWFVIDGEKPIEEVFNQILNVLQNQKLLPVR